MNESPDPLDVLLAQTPPPPAPPWFEQRLMARLRTGVGLPWWQRAWLCLTPRGQVLLAVATAALVLGLWLRPTPVPQDSVLAQEDFNQAFETLAAYTEQTHLWNIEW